MEEHELILMKNDIEMLKKQYEELQESIEPIEKDNIRTDEKFKQIIDTLDEVKNDVKILKDRPSKFYDYLIMVIMSSVIAFLFTHFGGV